MRLIVIVCLLSFSNFLSSGLANIIPEPNIFEEDEISSTNLEQPVLTYNPDVDLDTLGMIRRAGYPAEAHTIKTEDGYILKLHRIPGGNGSLPVLLLHALLCSSADFVILGKGKALAYLLADQGYDVWLGNFRGNTYSRAHAYLSTSDKEFWDFSFHEMGIYDLPAMITYITDKRSQPLHTYIGHSIGTTSFYVMASERPNIAEKIKLMISLAPTAFLNNMRSPLRRIAFLTSSFKWMMELLFHNELLSRRYVYKFFLKYGCNLNSIEQRICTNLLFRVIGDDYGQLDYTLLPVILSHMPAGTSVKTLLHLIQIFKSGKFQKYDYSRTYNSMISSEDYKLENIKVPIALLYSLNDLLIQPKDVMALANKLPNIVDLYEVPWNDFNHCDYVYARDAPNLVYNRVFKLMNEITQKKNQTINYFTSKRRKPNDFISILFRFDTPNRR